MIPQDEIPVPLLGGFIGHMLIALYWLVTMPLRFWEVIPFEYRLSARPDWANRAEDRMLSGGYWYWQ